MSAAAPAQEPGAAAFPWNEAMSLGMGRLGLPASAFWAMTPLELAAAMAPMAAGFASPPSRLGLDALMRRFPDETR